MSKCKMQDVSVLCIGKCECCCSEGTGSVLIHHLCRRIYFSYFVSENHELCINGSLRQFQKLLKNLVALNTSLDVTCLKQVIVPCSLTFICACYLMQTLRLHKISYDYRYRVLGP
jgi:hypothetical protein